TLPHTSALYSLSLHAALPILAALRVLVRRRLQRATVELPHLVDAHADLAAARRRFLVGAHVVTDELAFLHHEGELGGTADPLRRSEEHTSELQSRENLVCRLL